jgi:DNA-binding XRE family transcriptional regulator
MPPKKKPWTLAEWRTSRQLNKSDAAKLIGCSRQSLDNWESGATETPRYIHLACAAISAGIEVEEGA